MSIRPLFLDRATAAASLTPSESTIEKLVREDQFPKPRVLSGRRLGWLTREVEEWAESRPVSDLPPPENTAHGAETHTLAERIARSSSNQNRAGEKGASAFRGSLPPPR